MKNKSFWTAFFVVLALALAIYLFPIWQLIALIGFLAGLIAENPKSGFTASFGGIFFSWLFLLCAQSLSYPISGSARLLAEILGLSGSMWVVIALLTLVIGGLLAGLSALAGAYLKSTYSSAKL